MKIRHLIAAFAAIAIVSCTDKIDSDSLPGQTTKPGGGIVFTATTESPATKTTLSGDDASGYQVNWCNGDKIAVRKGVSGTQPVAFYTTTSNSSHGEFTFDSGAELATDYGYYAVYPTEYWNTIQVTYPLVQNYTPGVIRAPMFAFSGDTNLQFKNIGGLIRINLKTPLHGKKIKKIYLSSQDQCFSGTVSNTSSLERNPTAVINDSYPSQHPVVLECSNEGVEIGADPTPFYIAVPANNYTNLTIGVVAVDGIKQTYKLKSEQSIVVERSSITDITLTFDNDSEITDLSENGTANTYIASSIGYYKFKATVKGNGGLDPVTGTTATEINKNDISGVTVLWDLKSRNNAVYYDGKMQAHDIYYHDGYIYFYKNFNFEGNTYVSIFKDKEGGTDGVYDKGLDEILWSWLIWSTTPGTVVYNGNMFMDRNIGSVTQFPFADGGYTAGFSYQWGRPYPFASAYNKEYTPYSYVPTRTAVFDFPSFPSGTTVEYSVSHPTSFFQPASGNWMSTTAFRNNMWSDDVKTIYDPSPVGWKVPSKEQLAGITSAIEFYGAGFIGTCSGDFGYGNPGSVLLWSSSCDNYNTVWANAYGNITSTQVDVYFRSGMQIRPVQDVSSLTYADLSATETANSYIVPGPGNYKFKATVKGNGAADLAGISRTTNASEIASADLVWASYGTNTAPLEGEMFYGLHYEGDYVYFSVPETFRQGNAVVAVKNSGGTVLWSWHLWFTDADIEGLAQTYPSGAVLMDRNLGALSATYNSSNTADWGLMYQWGRKDPFHNSVRPTFISGYISSSNASTVNRPAILGTAENYLTAMQPNITVAYVNQFPQYLFKSWYISSTESDQTEWAYDMTDDLWAADKTIFDPCPSGWQVPDKAVWEGSFVTDLDAASLSNNGFTVSGIRYPNTAVRLPNAVYSNGGYKQSNGGLILENLSDYHIFVWAFNGQLHKEKFSYENPGGSTPPVTTGTYQNRPIRSSFATESEFASAISPYYSAIPSHAQTYFSRSRAGAVRCVRVRE